MKKKKMLEKGAMCLLLASSLLCKSLAAWAGELPSEKEGWETADESITDGFTSSAEEGGIAEPDTDLETADVSGAGTADVSGTGTADVSGTGTADVSGTGTADISGADTADTDFGGIAYEDGQETGFESETAYFTDDAVRESDGQDETDRDTPSSLTEEEREAQLAPIRELQPVNCVEAPSGSGLEDGGESGAARASAYPSRYDTRGSLTTSVKNQKPSNMCWAFTLAANLEASFLRKGQGGFDLSEEHLAYFFANRVNDPLGNTPKDRNIVQHNYRDGGNQTLAAIFLSTWCGMASESDVPYLTDESHTVELGGSPSKDMAYKTAAYLENAAFSDYSVTRLKKLIMEYGSVSLSFNMFEDYYNPETCAYSFPVSGTGANHAVTLVGWDDSYSRDNFSAASQVDSDGAWIAKNSWGEEWGDGGYFYISYDNKSNYNIVAAEAVTAPAYKNNYFYDGSSALSKLTLRPSGSGGTSAIANIFTASAGNGKGEALGEVVLATYTDKGSYSIQVYTNLTDKADPTSGVPAYSTPVRYYQEYAGISTVTVPEVTLLPGTLYSVVVTNTGTDSVAYLCETDGDYDWVEFEAGLTAKKSFCYREGSGWTDLSKNSPGACVRLKAHTRTLDSAGRAAAPSSLKAAANSYNKIKLSWKKASGVSGYQIYRKESGGSYKKIGTVSWEKNTYTDTSAMVGVQYTYKVRAYCVVNGKNKYSAYTGEVSQKTSLSVPKVSVKVSYALYNEVTWDKVSGAQGYIVYRKASGNWKSIAKIKGTKTLSWRDKDISPNTSYEYTVRAYRTVYGKTVKSSYKSSGVYKSAPSLQKVSSVTNTASGLKVKWSPQKKCDGYYIYRKVGSGSFRRVAVKKTGSSSSWTDTSVKSGKSYTYYVRAYVKEPGGVVKSRYKASGTVTRK